MPDLDAMTDQNGRVMAPNARLAGALFRDTRAGWLWLLVRLWVGWQWLEAGWRKLTNPAWTDGSGRAIRGFWEKSPGAEPSGEPVITFGWYRVFIQLLTDTHSEGWFSWLIVGGELAIGLGVLLGAYIWLTAGAGLTMNLAYMLAGSARTNPVLMLLEILLILAWRNAGYLGLDRWLLPAVGTPWWRAPRSGAQHGQPERVIQRRR